MRITIKALKLYALYLVLTVVIYFGFKIILSDDTQVEVQNTVKDIVVDKTPLITEQDTSLSFFFKIFLITLLVHATVVVIGKLIKIPKIKLGQLLYLLLAVVVALVAGGDAFGGGLTSYGWTGGTALVLSQIEWIGAALLNTAASKISLKSFIGPFFVKPKFILTFVGIILMLAATIGYTMIFAGKL